MSLLEQRLGSVEEHALAVIEAASQKIELPLQNELWWPDLIAQYGSETALFEAIGVDKALFDEVFSLVENVAGPTRGRRCIIRMNREKLLFMLIFMIKGVGVLEPRA